jgi:hypothetical protein
MLYRVRQFMKGMERYAQHFASTDVVFVIICSLLLLWCAINIQFTFFYDRLTVKGEFEVKVGL